MAINYPKEGNPHWPLPPDFFDLTEDGKRLARINVVASRGTPEDDVTSWAFFRSWYLCDEEAHWYQDYKAPADGHVEWAEACAKYDRVVIGAHRGSAKSTIFKEMVIRDLCSQPHSKTMLVNSTLSRLTLNLNDIMRQLEYNERIKKDFGKLRPGRSEVGIWNHQQLALRNGAELFGVSVDSIGMRGYRPWRILLDDPEYDPKGGTSIDKLIENMETVIFQILLPSLRPGCVFHWLGTPISARLYLWRFIENSLKDKRIDPTRWFRKIYPGLRDPEDDTSAFWPEEWPPERVAALRKELGNQFGPEFLCMPSEGVERPLVINPQVNYYNIENFDPRDEGEPLLSMAPINYPECRMDSDRQVTVTDVRCPARELFGRLFRFITVDAIRVPSPTSDWAVIHVMGVDSLNELFSLDMWAGRVTYGPLCTELWKKVSMWRPRVVGVESHAMELHMLQEVQFESKRFVEQFGWCPQIIPIQHKRDVKKEDRIQGLAWRFPRGLIKLPRWRTDTFPYNMLWHQITNFTSSGKGLDHDDAVDTLAMAHDIIKAAPPTTVQDVPTTLSPIELLKGGQKFLPGGIPAILACNLNELPSGVLDQFLGDYEQDKNLPTQEVKSWSMSAL